MKLHSYLNIDNYKMNIKCSHGKKKSNLPCNGRKQVRRLLQSSKTMLKDEFKNP